MSKVKIEGNPSGTGTLTIAAPNTNTDRTLTLPDADITLGGGVDGVDSDYTSGTAVKIDSSGNVGIGTSSPSSKLQIQAGDLNVGGNDASNPFSKIRLGATQYGACDIVPTDDSSHKVGMAFYTDGTADTTINPTERMRIDSSGNLLVGTTGVGANAMLQVSGYNDGGKYGSMWRPLANNSTPLAFMNAAGSVVGTIQCSSSSTSYITSSDYRLKTDVQPMTGATERLKALKPVNFEWISTGERVDGFLAHEAQEVVPEAVTGTKDAMRTEEYEVTPAVLDDDGNVVTEAVMGEREVPDYQGIDQSKLVPLLVAAMQEQQSTIEDLTSRLAALESN